mgnify:CR=1 FL=1
MEQKINLWSYFLSIICISCPINCSIMGTYPLNLVLYITLTTFVLRIFGLSGIQDWKGMTRSITTVIITLGLSTFLAIVLFFGSLLS